MLNKQSKKVIAAQAKGNGAYLHIQFKHDSGNYGKTDVPYKPFYFGLLAKAKEEAGQQNSLAGTETKYIPLTVQSDGVWLGSSLLVQLKNFKLS